MAHSHSGDEACFNLLTQPWIPVLYADGRYERVGILKALEDAGSIREIAASNPMDRVALLRFLLAVLYWCRGSPTADDEQRLTTEGRFPPGWLAKLEAERDCFNLLGEGRRFMQPDAGCGGSSRPVADLFHEVPGDTNIAHALHVRDKTTGVCPACAAIGLVRLPVAITGKGKGKRPGINGDPPAYFVPVGPTLLATMVCNLIDGSGSDPCWSRSYAPQAEQIGLAEGFTWTSRQFRLVGERLGRCCLCGDDKRVVLTEVIEVNSPNGRAGLSRSKEWRDPHLVYSEDGKGWRAEDSEKDLPSAEGQWRDWMAALSSPARLQIASTGAMLAVGFATRTNDKAIECWSQTHRLAADTLPLRDLEGQLSALLDPRTTLTGKRLASFKKRHPLRAIRSKHRPLSEAVRAALAHNLPALECDARPNPTFADSIPHRLWQGRKRGFLAKVFTTKLLRSRSSAARSCWPECAAAAVGATSAAASGGASSARARAPCDAAAPTHARRSSGSPRPASGSHH